MRTCICSMQGVQIYGQIEKTRGEAIKKQESIKTLTISKSDITSWANKYGDKEAFGDKAFNPTVKFFTLGAEFITENNTLSKVE